MKQKNTNTAMLLAAVAIILSIPTACNYQTSSNNESATESVVQESPRQIPSGWTLHKNNIYSIAYPQSMEIRDAKSKYQQDLNQAGLPSSDGNTVIFQQKGLNEKESDAYTQYIRVMITPTEGNKGDFLKANISVH